MRPLVCQRCNGKGKTVTFREREHIFMSWYVWQECPVCQGSGYHHGRLETAKSAFAPLIEPMVTLASCLSSHRSADAAPKPAPRLATLKF